MNSKRVFDLLERISALVRNDARRQAMPHELQPVHLQVLDYLSRANRFSDMPQAVGEYLGLTKGNMSQRINVLERLALIRKVADASDGRVVHLALTATGKRLLNTAHPPPSWRDAESLVSAKQLRDLEEPLAELMHALVAANGFKTFGQCKTCRFHRQQNRQPFCGLLQVELDPDQADRICREHQPLAA